MLSHRLTSRPHPSRPARLALGLATVPLLIGLTGCSGDDDDSADGPGNADGAATATETPEPGSPTRECRADIRVSGAVDVVWDGTATVRFADPESDGAAPDAVYVAERNKNQVSVYSSGEDFVTAATFASGKRAFSAQPDGDAGPQGVEAQSDGSMASVNTYIYDVDGERALLRAEFDCTDDAS